MFHTSFTLRHKTDSKYCLVTLRFPTCSRYLVPLGFYILHSFALFIADRHTDLNTVESYFLTWVIF